VTPPLAVLRLILAAIIACAAVPAIACDATTPCEIGSGRYYVRPPAGWDGRSPLPAAGFFHGYRGSGAQTMAHEALGLALSKAGVLLVAADGQNGTWTIEGRLSSGRDDIAYVRDLLADLRKRFPVDERRLVATGFSAGGFMVWQIACQAGGLFAAYAPLSGAFLDPVPESCATGPVSLRHIHGKADVVVPMAGRWIAGGRVRQADVERSIDRMREIDGCQIAPSKTERQGDLTCRTWPATQCAGRRELQACLHEGAHDFDPAWIVEGMEWAGRLPPR